MCSSDEKKPKLLIVDDNPNEMNSLAIGLRLEGFDAEGVESGKAALEALDKAQYAVVLIDLMMPEMNGLQLARRIKEAYPDAFTIMMSAYHLSPVQLAKADTGVVGFVPKPFRFEELVVFIRSKLNAEQLPVMSSDYASTGISQKAEIPVVIGEMDIQRPATPGS